MGCSRMFGEMVAAGSFQSVFLFLFFVWAPEDAG